jgi:hypothetical protein
MHVAAPTPEKRQIVAFEMPPGKTADAAPTVNKAFNSLFEMLRWQDYRAGAYLIYHLSILYLRCPGGPVAEVWLGAGLLFQFSI